MLQNLKLYFLVIIPILILILNLFLIIKMLINKELTKKTKLLWLIVLITLPITGFCIYFLLEKNKLLK